MTVDGGVLRMRGGEEEEEQTKKEETKNDGKRGRRRLAALSHKGSFFPHSRSGKIFVSSSWVLSSLFHSDLV